MNEVAELRSRLIKARQAYYFGGKPIMTDQEYDVLEAEFTKLCPNDPLLGQIGCPVPPDHILEVAEHRMPMTSQDKVNSVEEFLTWYANRARDGKVNVSLKGDGSSAAAYFENGFLVLAVSRGDGKVGENITAAALKFKGLPAYIETKDGPFTGAIRFEAILTKADWAIVGGKNPRNQGSGIIGRKDGTEAEHMTAYAFDIANGIQFATVTEKFEYLESLGITTMPSWTFDNPDDVVAKYNQIMEARGGTDNTGRIPFWIDGLVIQVDDLQVQKQIGYAPSGKYHKAQVAWKPETEGTETKLIDFEITGGHTGKLVPNARLEPVEIGGSTVRNALLNNWEEIARLDVAVGDTVLVIKANDIIPKVIAVVKRPEDRKPIVEPTSCPFCGGNVQRREIQKGEGADTMCVNPDCPAKGDGKLKTFIKKVEILGIGDSVREALASLGVLTPADIYRLGRDITEDELETLPIGDSKLGGNAGKIIAEIDAKRHLPLNIFLGSLGIDGLGRREVEIACQKAPDQLSTLADWRSDKLMDVDLQIKINAPTKAERWYNGIKAASKVIDGLLANGVTVEDFEQEAAPVATGDGPVAGKSFVLTGKMSKPRAEIEAVIRSKGGIPKDEVTKGVHYLVQADPNSQSSKTKKAVKVGTAVISEATLWEMLA